MCLFQNSSQRTAEVGIAIHQDVLAVFQETVEWIG